MGSGQERALVDAEAVGQPIREDLLANVGLSCWQCSAPVSSSESSRRVTSSPFAFPYS
jgi:hypothetical protein